MFDGTFHYMLGSIPFLDDDDDDDDDDDGLKAFL